VPHARLLSLSIRGVANTALSEHVFVVLIVDRVIEEVACPRAMRPIDDGEVPGFPVTSVGQEPGVKE